MILASFLRIKQTYNMCIKVNTYYSTLNLEQLMYLEHSSCRSSSFSFLGNVLLINIKKEEFSQLGHFRHACCNFLFCTQAFARLMLSICGLEVCSILYHLYTTLTFPPENETVSQQLNTCCTALTVFVWVWTNYLFISCGTIYRVEIQWFVSKNVFVWKNQ